MYVFLNNLLFSKYLAVLFNWDNILLWLFGVLNLFDIGVEGSIFLLYCFDLNKISEGTGLSSSIEESALNPKLLSISDINRSFKFL